MNFQELKWILIPPAGAQLKFPENVSEKLKLSATYYTCN